MIIHAMWLFLSCSVLCQFYCATMEPLFFSESHGNLLDFRLGGTNPSNSQHGFCLDRSTWDQHLDPS